MPQQRPQRQINETQQFQPQPPLGPRGGSNPPDNVGQGQRSAEGGSLDNPGTYYSSCEDYHIADDKDAWELGNGVSANADSDVPSDQGTGKYGAIESWDVSRVQSMNRSECVCVMCLLKREFGLRCAAGVPCSPHRPRASAASAREFCVSSVAPSFLRLFRLHSYR